MNPKLKATQGGSVLLEAMISILIFSFGVLGIVGLQSAMISGASEAKYRNEAGFFANRLLGEMATADRSSAAALTTFATAGASYVAWYNDIKNTTTTGIGAGLLGLPGADTNPPMVNIVPINKLVNGVPTPTHHDVTVSVFWQSPGQPMHRHVVSASISAD